MTKIKSSRKKVSAARLSEVEKTLGIELPKEYQQFLLKHNGGSPSPNGFKYSIVKWFLAIYSPGMKDVGSRDDNFVENFEIYKGDEPRIPKELVPIAIDTGGNLVGIAVSGKNLGKIYFWDHDGEGLTDKPTYRNVSLLANSFNEFLKKLHD